MVLVGQREIRVSRVSATLSPGVVVEGEDYEQIAQVWSHGWVTVWALEVPALC